MSIFKRIFPSQDRSLTEKNDEEKMIQALARTLSAHKVACTAEEGARVLTVCGLAVEAFPTNRKSHKSVVSLQLNYRISHPAFPDDCREALAGIGKTADDAIWNGTEAFVDGILLPILGALGGNRDALLDFRAEFCASSPHLN